MSNEDILKFIGVSISREDDFILKNVNLQIKNGSFNLITGPSGSGKSTLLRLIPLLEYFDGDILFNNISIKSLNLPEFRKQLGYIQQSPIVISGSVKDNLLLPFNFNINKNIMIPTDNRLLEGLKSLNLETSLEKDALTLSIGQKQRLSILRTLLLKPNILLMDEPTSALDPESSKIIESIAENLVKENNGTVLMISHSDYIPSIDYFNIIIQDKKVLVNKVDIMVKQ